MVRSAGTRAWFLLLLLLPLCAAVTLALWQSRGSPALVTGAGAPSRDSEARGAGLAAAASRPEPRAGERTAAAEDEPRVLSRLFGKVVADDERPVAGARVVVWPAERLDFAAALGEGTNSSPLRSTTTAADGRFAIDGVTPRTRLHLQVTDGRSAVHAFEPLANPEPGGVLDLGTIRLAPRATVRGRIVESGGDAVAGARVRFASSERDRDALWLAAEGAMLAHKVGPAITLCPALQATLRGLDLPTATTDARGRFELSGAERGHGWLIVERDAHVPVLAAEALVTDAPAVELGTVMLVPEVGWSVRVLDATGEAVAGAHVAGGTRRDPGNDTLLCKVARSDTEGRASFWLAKDGEPRVAVRAHDTDPWLVLSVEDDADHTVRLPAPFVANVRVVDCDGKPVDDATLHAVLAPRNMFMQAFDLRIEGMRARRVAPGTYELSGPPLPRAHVAATARRGSSKLALVEAGGSGVELRIEAPEELELRVVDEAGQPVAGASIEIAEKGWFASRAHVGATGPDGTLRFCIPPDEPFDLDEGVLVEVRHPVLGHASTTALGGSGPVVVRFRGCGAIHGRLLDGDGPPREPVRLRIECEPRTRGGSWSVAVDREGGFTVSGLQQGTWTLSVERDEPAPQLDALFGRNRARPALAATRVEVRAGATSQVALQLSRAARMQGVPGAFVRGTLSFSGWPLDAPRILATGAETVVADVRGGSFDLGKLTIGQWRIALVDANAPQEALWSTTLAVAAGRDRILDYRLELGALELRADLDDPSRARAARIEVEAIVENGGRLDHRASLPLGADLRTTRMLVPAGKYRVRLVGAAERPGSWRGIDVVGGQVARGVLAPGD